MRCQSIDVPGAPGIGSATGRAAGVVVGAAELSGALDGALSVGVGSCASVVGALDPAGASGVVVDGTDEVRALAESVLTPSADVHAAVITRRAPTAAEQARRRPRGDMSRMV